MKADETAMKEVVDLTNCDREPIHIPGSIQPHGVLFVLEEPSLKILQVSNNTLSFLGYQAEDLLGKSLDYLFSEYYINDLKKYLKEANLQAINPLKIGFAKKDRNLAFHGIIHRSVDGNLILELEPDIYKSPNLASQDAFSFYHLIRGSLANLQSSANLHELAQVIAQEVRKLTSFDRVMIYQFDRDKNGYVLAEAKADWLPSFLGMHYPASDIPKQARNLYLTNWLRFIANINYEPVAIVPTLNPLTQQPIDLSASVLRSVSPLHVEYLQNMGVAASMSISLIHNQDLWGLIACHHYTSKYVPYEVRTACELLGQVMSLELTSKAGREDYDYEMQLQQIQAKLIEYMSKEDNFIDALVTNETNLLQLTNAEGAVIYFQGELTTLGKTPEPQDLLQIISFLQNEATPEIFATDSLGDFVSGFADLTKVACGLLSIAVSRSQGIYVLWFRPEVIQTVHWGGNPNKPVEIADDGSARLTPRKSFDLWKQTVQGKAIAWKNCEIKAAEELRHAIIGIVIRQIDELASLNASLQESEAKYKEQAHRLSATLKELQDTQTQLIQSEKMSSLGQLVAGVAHEINNPVNFIYGNLSHAENHSQDLIDLLLTYQEQYPNPTPQVQAAIANADLEFVLEDLPKLLSSMRVGAERIREIVKSLRTFSRLDEAALKPVDIHEGLESTLMILQNRLKSRTEHVAIEVNKNYSNLPKVECYAGQLNQVFMNIITNAIDTLDEATLVKNSEFLPKIWISTKFNEDEQLVEISIKDNGLGMTEAVKQKLFDPFFTTKPVGQGTGIGLSISYQIIVDKHKGKLICLSTPEIGTEFIISIPLKQS